MSERVLAAVKEGEFLKHILLETDFQEDDKPFPSIPGGLYTHHES